MARAAAARVAAPAPRRSPGRTRSAPPRRKPAAARPTLRPKSRSARLAALPHSPFVDRLLTGRAWIVLMGGLLAGIVFLNVALLELNAGIARTTERVSALKRENGRLRLQAARLGSTERIQQAAAGIGLVLPAPGQVRYLEADPAKDLGRALSRMRSPDDVIPVAAAPVAPAPVAEEPMAPVEPVATEPAPVATEPAPATSPQAAVTPTTEPTG